MIVIAGEDHCVFPSMPPDVLEDLNREYCNVLERKRIWKYDWSAVRATDHRSIFVLELTEDGNSYGRDI